MRNRLSLVCVTVLLVIGGGVAVTTAANAVPVAHGKHYRLNPKHNIKAPTTAAYGACHGSASATRCENVLIKALNHARHVMGQPKYKLPAKFRSLSGRDQLLVLSNADRRLYGRTPVRGINPQLNKSAAKGVKNDGDPAFVYRVNGAGLRSGGSNWAGGTAPMNSALYAYYEWMYDDGPGSNNIDCQHKGDPGCWGHRDNVLFQSGDGTQVELGVGSGKDHNGLFGWTQLFEGFEKKATIPCLPSVVGLSKHAVSHHGGTVVVHGYGFVQVTKVTAGGQRAAVRKHTPNTLVLHVRPHKKGHGYVVVTTRSGSNGATGASLLRFR